MLILGVSGYVIKIFLDKWLNYLKTEETLIRCHIPQHLIRGCTVCQLAYNSLTLKAPRKTASENVVCLCRLLNVLASFQTYFCMQANSVEPDQTAPRKAV